MSQTPEQLKAAEALADNLWLVLLAYCAAFLPWAILQALDFISDKWSTIRYTRRYGYIHLFFSFGPFIVVAFYIHFQSQGRDYKEMSAGVIAVIICLIHILRTIWGLLQLHAFKKWNARALNCLRSMGYALPSFAKDVDEDTDVLTVVDKVMLVNHSLIDNEFRGTELPCYTRKLSELTLADIRNLNVLGCKMMEECIVRWSVSFLSMFGAKWLRDVEIKPIEGNNWMSAQKRFSQNLGVFAALHVTRAHFPDSLPDRKELISLIAPLHSRRSHTVMESTVKAKFMSKEAFPYSHRKKESEELYFHKYIPTIRHAIGCWDSKALNSLTDLERNAVENITSFQIAAFMSLLNQNEWQGVAYRRSFEPLDKDSDWEKDDIRVETLASQLGCEWDQNTVPELVGRLPFRSDYFWSLLWSGKKVEENLCNRLILQVSVHVDNWLALEAGLSFTENFELGFSPTFSSVENLEESDFERQKAAEIARLEVELCRSSDTEFPHVKQAPQFLGVILESVRSVLAEWMLKFDLHSSSCVWDPILSLEPVKFQASPQLRQALRDMRTASERDGRWRSLHMRLIWETQYHLHHELVEAVKTDNLQTQLPACAAAMMLCVLGFPSIVIRREDEVVENNQSKRSRLLRKLRARVTHVYKISPVDAPNNVEVHWRCDDESCEVQVQLKPKNNEIVNRKFYWQSWRDSFWGRLSGQQEWRVRHELSVTEDFRIPFHQVPISRGIQNMRMEAGGLPFVLKHWAGWLPHHPAVSWFEMVHSKGILFGRGSQQEEHYSKSDHIVLGAGVRRLGLALDSIANDLGAGDSKNSIDFVQGDNTEAAPGDELFAKAFVASQNGLEDLAVELMCRSVEECGHLGALKAIVAKLVDRKGIEGRVAEELFSAITNGLYYRKRKSEVSPHEFSLEQLIHFVQEIYKATSDPRALLLEGQALFYFVEGGDAAQRDSINCFNHVATRGGFSSGHENEDILISRAHLYLAVHYLRKFKITARDHHRKIGTEHLKSYAYLIHDGNAALAIARLLEKGVFYGSDVERAEWMYETIHDEQLKDMLKELVDKRYDIENLATWKTLADRTDQHASADVVQKLHSEFQQEVTGSVVRDIRGAAKMYWDMCYADGRIPFPIVRRDAPSRLAHLHHTHTSEVELALQDELKDTEFSPFDLNKRCRNNRAVHLALGAPTTSVDVDGAIELLEDANNAVQEPGHFTAVNNLAVLLESDGKVTRAAGLYEKAAAKGHPVAMYNLGVLLKWGKGITKDVERAQSLFTEVYNKGNELVPMCNLIFQVRRAPRIDAIELLKPWKFKLAYDELDGYLALVKLLDDVSRREKDHKLSSIATKS